MDIDTTPPVTMDIHAILEHLPHRYPFLLVDKVVSLQRNERIQAIKNVTFNEPYLWAISQVAL
jgi:3-hydroxymyristoyl/3-hydroxydecanoyl-(acyl carrier protein) dehydratase